MRNYSVAGQRYRQRQTEHTLEVCQPPHTEIDAVTFLFIVEGTATFDGGGFDANVTELPDGRLALWGLVRATGGACRPFTIVGDVVHAEIGDGPHFLRWDGVRYDDITTFINDVVVEPSVDDGTNGDGTNGGGTAGGFDPKIVGLAALAAWYLL